MLLTTSLPAASGHRAVARCVPAAPSCGALGHSCQLVRKVVTRRAVSAQCGSSAHSKSGHAIPSGKQSKVHGSENPAVTLSTGVQAHAILGSADYSLASSQSSLSSASHDHHQQTLEPHSPGTSTRDAAPPPLQQPLYETIMLKVSGEALQGEHGFGVDSSVLERISQEIAAAHRHGIKIAIVVGGGNYFRGATAWKGLDRATADYVGMLATVMNALLLQGALERLGVPTRVQTAIEMREVAEPYIRRRAISHLEKGRVVIFGAGTGNPFFTTDTAAALRAAEINAKVFLKATKVDGVYDSDPMHNKDAKRYDRLSYRQVTIGELQVMDETAVTLCKENQIPVIVFSISERGNILRAALGEPVGTVVGNGV